MAALLKNATLNPKPYCAAASCEQPRSDFSDRAVGFQVLQQIATIQWVYVSAERK
jgi:hypothetical protein